jgi:hypothetical protein
MNRDFVDSLPVLTHCSPQSLSGWRTFCQSCDHERGLRISQGMSILRADHVEI